MNESENDDKTRDLNPHFTQSMTEEKDRLVGNGHEYICTNKLLGRGNFSHVYDGYMCVFTPVAIKKIHMNAIEKEKNQKYLKSEIQIMKKLKHDNIVNLLDVIWKDGQLNIILEQCGGGDLKKYLEGKAMREEYVQFYAKQLASGLEYLYKNKIIHRDLKPQNLLLNSDYTVLKISDFGFAKIIGAEAMAQTICGTPMYMAPEIMNVEPYTDRADLWSVGIILFEMFFARYPFHGMKNQYELMKLMKTDIKIDIPTKPVISNEAKNLIKNLLLKDSQKRLKWNDFFAHPWLKLHFTKSKKQEPAQPKQQSKIDNFDFNYNAQKQVQPLVPQQMYQPSPSLKEKQVMGSVGGTKDGVSIVGDVKKNVGSGGMSNTSFMKDDIPKDDKNSNPFGEDSDVFSTKEHNLFKFDEEDSHIPSQYSTASSHNGLPIDKESKRISKTKPIPIMPSYNPQSDKKKPIHSFSVPANMGCDIWSRNDSNSPMSIRNQADTFSPTQADISLHINSTSPFVKSYNPVKLNIVDDYSSLDIVPSDPNFRYSSMPVDMNRRDAPTERNAFSLMSMRGKKIREEDEEKVSNGGNVSKIFKDYAVASYHLVKDSLKSFNGLN